MQFEEWVIMSDVHIHLAALADATKVYVEATNSSVRLIVENERMAKELQMEKQREEQIRAATREELRK